VKINTREARLRGASAVERRLTIGVETLMQDERERARAGEVRYGDVDV
jgi:hypothetical protein